MNITSTPILNYSLKIRNKRILSHSRPRFRGDKLAPVKTGGGNPENGRKHWIPGQARNDGWLILFLFTVLLSSCATGPDYQRPQLDIPSTWRIEYQTAADNANTAWWEQFGDPALNELIKSALSDNRDLRIAAARVEEFTGRLQSIRSGLFPQVNYTAAAARESYSLERAIPLPNGVERRNTTDIVGGSVGWELDIWGRLRRATEAARADMLSEEEGRQAVILTLVSDVARGYIGLLTLDKILETSRQTLASREEFLQVFERKFKGGQISGMELAQVRSSYEQVAEFIPEVERRIVLQENALSILLGRNPGKIIRGKTLDELVMPQIPQGIPSDLLVRRPDIRRTEQNLIAANARIGVARAQYFPSISLTGIFGFASTTLSNLLEDTAGFWQVTADATGPLFTGGRLKGQTRSAEALQQQLLSDYVRTIQTAFQEVNDALAGIQKYQERLKIQDRHVATLKEYYSSAHNRYDSKYISYIEVIDAENKLFNTQVDYAQTQDSLLGAMVNSYKAMGGGWVTEAEKRIATSGKRDDR